MENITSCRSTSLFIAAVHYFYMRDVWVATGETPTVYRYIDWLLTVPLQMIEFYLILAAIGLASAGMFWRLLIGTMVMLVAGFMGEAGYINSMVGFVIGMLDGSTSCTKFLPVMLGSKRRFSASKAHLGTCLVVTIGWAIYPLGYVLGYFVMVDASGATTAAASQTLNVVYNLADIVNKLAFCHLFGTQQHLITKI